MKENTKNARINVRSITFTAVMAALVFVFTYTFKIPFVNGYTHIGDSMIFLAIVFLGYKKAPLAAGIGAGLAGLGGLYFVMEYSGGTWTDNGFGDRGWLAVALVIFALWKPLNAIWGAFLFGALYILYLYIPGLGRSMQEVFKALPYVVTIIVLVFTSFRKKKEHQPPAALGLPYFREER